MHLKNHDKAIKAFIAHLYFAMAATHPPINGYFMSRNWISFIYLVRFLLRLLLLLLLHNFKCTVLLGSEFRYSNKKLFIM